MKLSEFLEEKIMVRRQELYLLNACAVVLMLNILVDFLIIMVKSSPN